MLVFEPDNQQFIAIPEGYAQRRMQRCACRGSRLGVGDRFFCYQVAKMRKS
jgi:hypothetical protein